MPHFLFLPFREKNEVRTQREKWVQLCFCMEIFFLYMENNEDLGFDQSPVSLNKQTLTWSRLPVSAFLTFLPVFVFCFNFFPNLIHSTAFCHLHTNAQNTPLQHYVTVISALHQISMHLSSNKQGQHQVRVNKWLLMRSLPSIPALYLFLPFSISSIHSHFSVFFPFNVYITPNTVCSFYWLLRDG